MKIDIDRSLERWVQARVIEPEAAARIREFEVARTAAASRRWPVLIALICGGILLAAGILLFVAAHWETLSPVQRFLAVTSMVASTHVAAALLGTKSRAFAVTLHGVGTVGLGAGIAVSGQIFHLQEHWPAAVMLWAAGALIGYLLLRDWVQAGLLALLAPAWLMSEWVEFSRHAQPMFEGMALLSLAYVLSRRTVEDAPERRVLRFIGLVFMIPAWALLAQEVHVGGWRPMEMPSLLAQTLARVLAYGLPLALALKWLDRSRQAVVAAAALWIGLAVLIGAPEIAMYGWAAVAAVAFVAWGVRENSADAINVGTAGFALTVAIFYFSSVLDKMGRATSLISLGLLFLVGGWVLERTRRTLLARAAGGEA